MAPALPPAVSTALQLYLGFLAVHEALTIYRLSTGSRLPAVVPLYLKDNGPAYTQLLVAFSATLIIARLNAAWEPASYAAWRAGAMTHALAALFFAHVAFVDEGALPTVASTWRAVRHADATAAYALVLFNAALFAAVALVVGRHRAAWEASEAARRAAAAAEASEGGGSRKRR